MKKTKQLLLLAAVVALCGMTTGCKDKGSVQLPVNGTMEEALAFGDSPKAVEDLMKHVTIDDRYETLMEDKATDVAVYSLMKCSDTVSSEGYGMVIAKGDVKTAMPQMLHGRMPRARYDATTGNLWIVGGAMEGTGVNVERTYLLRFDEDGYASIVNAVEPYEMQEAWRKALTYSIDGQNITFYANGKPLTTVTNHIEDMGDFMDDAIYIGEQISYSIEDSLTVHITPGLNFVTGKVLHYDDMPTFSAKVPLDKDTQSIVLGEIKVEK